MDRQRKEHRQKFTAERAGVQMVKDPKDKSELASAANGRLIGEWFEKQSDKLFSSIRKTVTPPGKSKVMGDCRQCRREGSKFVFRAGQNRSVFQSPFHQGIDMR